MADRAVVREAQIGKRDLSVAWTDYRKAFDMVPHKWLRMVLKAIRAPRSIRHFIRRVIPLWIMNVTVRTTRGEESFPVHLQRGVFQGDSLARGVTGGLASEGCSRGTRCRRCCLACVRRPYRIDCAGKLALRANTAATARRT